VPRVPTDRKTHAGAGDVHGGQAYFPLVGRCLYAVELVVWKGDEWAVLYRVIGGEFDGHAGECPLHEFCKRVKP
jgi:hypothetical protein